MLRTRAVLSSPSPVAPQGDPLLESAGPLAGAKVLVIGTGTLETMCALIRAGCAAATEMRACDCVAPEPESADIVVVPRVASVSEASEAIAHGRRALTMGGHIALRDASFALRQTIVALLRAHGFSAVRTRITGGGAVMTAELPFFGPLPRA